MKFWLFQNWYHICTNKNMTLNERKILNIWGKKYLTESAALLCFNIYIFNMVTIGNLVNIFYVMFMRERFILCLTRWRFWIGGDYLLMRIDQLQIKCWRCIRLLIWYRYNWNIVESGIKHHTLLLIYLLYKRLKIVYGY